MLHKLKACIHNVAVHGIFTASTHLQNFAFGFLPGACLVMLVELILSAIFFVVCFNDQLGGWFQNATQGGLRSTQHGDAPFDFSHVSAQDVPWSAALMLGR